MTPKLYFNGCGSEPRAFKFKERSRSFRDDTRVVVKEKHRAGLEELENRDDGKTLKVPRYRIEALRAQSDQQNNAGERTTPSSK